MLHRATTRRLAQLRSSASALLHPPLTHTHFSYCRVHLHTQSHQCNGVATAAATQTQTQTQTQFSPATAGAAPAASLHHRFQSLSNQLLASSPYDDWQHAVRLLLELRSIETSLRASRSFLASSSSASSSSLQLAHFHVVFRSLLSAWNRDDSHVHYPAAMEAMQWTGEMISSCTGVDEEFNEDDFVNDAAAEVSDASDLQDNSSPPTSISSSASSSYIRHAFQPSHHFYASLMKRIQANSNMRSSSEASSSPSSTSAPSQATLLPSTSKGTLTTDLIHTHENMWHLMMAVEVCRNGGTCNEKELEERMENTESTASSSPLSPSPLPTLALVRHLFSCLLELQLRPTRQTMNYLLACHDSYARTIQLSPSLNADEPHDIDSPSAHPLLSATSHDLNHIWQLYQDLDRIYSIYPDLLTHTLMLRICYHYREYAYMAKILADQTIHRNLVQQAAQMLHHDFSSSQSHLVVNAFTHSSTVESRLNSNERMEFLGDAVLDVLIREMVGAEVMKEQNTNLAASTSSFPERSLVSPSSRLFSNDLLPSQSLARLKGKYVSHYMLVEASRQIGLSDLLLTTNSNVLSAIKKNERGHHSRDGGRRGSGRDQEKVKSRSEYQDGLTMRRQPQSPKREHDDDTHLHLPDNLAEDVFEACIAALFLDMPSLNSHTTNQVGESTPITPDLPPAASSSFSSSSLSSLSASANPASRTQAYGMSAARSFIRNVMGRALRNDCWKEMQQYTKRLGDNQTMTSYARREQRHNEFLQKQRQNVRRLTSALSTAANGDANSSTPVITSAISRPDFDRRLNYKYLLELYIRARYTDPTTHECNVHILYVLMGQIGAHAYRVRVAIKRVDEATYAEQTQGTYLHILQNQEQTRMAKRDDKLMKEGPASTSTPTSTPTSTLISTQTPASSSLVRDLSFSISFHQCPILHPEAGDREFSIANEMPDQIEAEQVAAFYALKEMRAI